MPNPAAIAIVGTLGLLALLTKKREPGEGDDERPDDYIDTRWQQSQPWLNADGKTASEVKAEADRIVRESAEIVQGKRDAYSDSPDEPVSPREAAERTKGVLDQVKSTQQTTSAAEEALAIEAARRAAEQEAAAEVQSKPAPAPKPVVVKPAPKPVVKPAPAPKPVVVKPAPAPAPKPVVTSSTSSGPPAGYDAVKAKNAAPGLAKHIQNTQYNYTRKALEAWQLVAGIPVDGVYGPSAATALKFYVATAPKALFKKHPKTGAAYPNNPYPPPEWKS